MTSFLHAYFTRLHCQPLEVPTVEALRTLHLAHNCAIPFENLDVLLPREIQLDETALEEKLLYARRGGYCFELNGLFERALRDIGFNVRSLLGRVILSHPASLPPRTHRLLLVDVEDEQWIADVGFGGQTLTAPLRLQAEIAQQTPHGEYRLMQEGSTWILQFRHHEHWPQSHFRHHLLMCRHLPDGGKLTLTNFHFTRYHQGHAVEQVNVPDVPSLYQLLQQQFGLGVNDVRHGFTEAELAAVMAAFDTHPEAGK
ncbi:N-hydroxyarylamine O-acetyltransferase [Salmonella enterica]|nr:N-hydroxyarylamine O-acetyltransferase [Salmonella enterica]EEN7000354.1 N-hydroxyarylamine O-acetyltransferase [Salmonella enterica]